MTSLSDSKPILHVLSRPEMAVIWLFWANGILLAILANIFFENIVLGVLAAILALTPNVFLTIREAKRLREDLNQTVSSSRLESIVTHLEDAVIAYDNDFKILVFNGAAAKMFGVAPDAVLGKTIGPSRVNEPPLALLIQTLFPSLAPAVVSRSEPNALPQVTDISFTDPVREFRVSTDKLMDSGHKPLGFVKVIRDRTREIQLMRSQSDFVSIAAHQLRTPLTAVHWTLESVSKGQPLNEEGETLVRNGLAATSSLLKMVNDLLNIAEIEEGRFGYKYEEIDLIKFVSDLLANAQLVAKKYGLQLYFDKGGFNELKLQADPTRLGLAVSNLIDNAMKYNTKNGSVTVGLRPMKNKPYIQIDVRDTGVGITPADMEKLFQKFFRASNAQKIQADGSGLGLYMTKNIIQQHGGSIWAESTIGRGTTFSFTLPTDPTLLPKAEHLGV